MTFTAGLAQASGWAMPWRGARLRPRTGPPGPGPSLRGPGRRQPAAAAEDRDPPGAKLNIKLTARVSDWGRCPCACNCRTLLPNQGINGSPSTRQCPIVRCVVPVVAANVELTPQRYRAREISGRGLIWLAVRDPIHFQQSPLGDVPAQKASKRAAGERKMK